MNQELPYVGEFIFCLNDAGIYTCITGNFSGTPADFCDEYDIAVPDDTQFLRVRSYVRNLHFEFRDYGSKIRINVHVLED